MHHGVKGMKWGVITKKIKSVFTRKKKEKDSNEQKKDSNEQKEDSNKKELPKKEPPKKEKRDLKEIEDENRYLQAEINNLRIKREKAQEEAKIAEANISAASKIIKGITERIGNKVMDVVAEEVSNYTKNLVSTFIHSNNKNNNNKNQGDKRTEISKNEFISDLSKVTPERLDSAVKFFDNAEKYRTLIKNFKPSA